MVVLSVTAFVVTVSVLFYKYSDEFSLDDEVAKPKELTPEMVRENTKLKQEEEARNGFLTRIMARENSLNSLMDSYDKLEKGTTTTRMPKVETWPFGA